jgi:hypothetical protein
MIENLDIEVNEAGTSIIRVPSGIRFISDWKDYNLDDFDFPQTTVNTRIYHSVLNDNHQLRGVTVL